MGTARASLFGWRTARAKEIMPPWENPVMMGLPFVGFVSTSTSRSRATWSAARPIFGESDADLTEALLYDARLFSADLSRADLSEAWLDKAYLSYAKLIEADLSSAQLRGADLGSANLGGAKLKGAVLLKAELDSANLRWADLREANLSNAVGLKQRQLDDACGDTKTKLPDGLSVPMCSEVNWHERAHGFGSHYVQQDN